MSGLLLAALVGCTSPGGVWLFSLHVDPDASDDCVSSVSHNFIDAAQPIDDDTLDDDPWTGTSATTVSDQTFFGLVTDTDSGATLVVAGQTYGGTRGDDGGWSFEWEHTTEVQDTDQHASGYGWTANTVSSQLTAYVLAITGDTATGERVGESAVEASYTESDAWSDQVAESIGGTGRIPASSYLVKDDGAGGRYAASNDQDLADCGTNPCTLSVSALCTGSVALDAERTDLDPAAFEGVDGAGQSAGL